MNPGGRGCSEPRSCHCIPAWVRELDSVSKKINKNLKKDAENLDGLNEGKQKTSSKTFCRISVHKCMVVGIWYFHGKKIENK